MSRAREEYWKAAASAAVAPTVRKDDGPHADSVESHPRYGQVRLSRVQGYSTMYGSDFPHQHTIEMEVFESELHRSLSDDRAYPTRPLLRLAFTEAQWGSFVSSMGLSVGTQCTFRRRITGDNLRYEGVPAIKEQRTSREKFSAESDSAVKAVLDQLDELHAVLSEETAGLSKSRRGALLDHVERARNLLGSSLPFVAEMFEEMLENRTESQKKEVMAWMENTIRQAGLGALVGDAGSPLLIEGDPLAGDE